MNSRFKELSAGPSEDLGEKLNTFLDALPKGAKLKKVHYKTINGNGDFANPPKRFALIEYEVQKEENRAGF